MVAKHEVGEHKLADIMRREEIKQEFWDSYADADNPKKVLSDFEKHLLKLKEQIEDSDMADINDSDLRTGAIGLTKRTQGEELISEYSRQCRETYDIPLGPRQRLGQRVGNENSAAQLATPEMLIYSGWSLGSDRFERLWNTSSMGMRGCRHINLSGNRIEDRSISLICAELLPTIETLDLSKNLLTHHGAKHLGDAIKGRSQKSPLLELNLEENMLGQVVEDDLCTLVVLLSSFCPHLRGLSLAKNQLGKNDGSLGGALGDMIKLPGNKLKVLDLHWNFFGGVGAYQFLVGLHENGHNDGNLARVDLSWNRLGTVDASHPNFVPAKVLADVLEDNKRLFHLDISHNQLGIEACRHLADGIRHNHTLMGLHIAGNAASLDANGFIVPQENPDSLRSQLINPDTLSFLDPDASRQRSASPSQRSQGRKSTCGGPRRATKRSTIAQPHIARNGCSAYMTSECDSHAVQLVRTLGEHSLGCLQLRAECCWICDRWRPVPIAWTPGSSGSLCGDAVDSVHVFLSIDGFRRPMPLVCSTASGNDMWVGQFMLPASSPSSPMLVIFLVNGCIEIAQDLPTRTLNDPVRINPTSEPQSAVPGQVTKEEDSTAIKISVVNELAAAPDDERHVGHSVYRQPLVVTEDLVEHGNLLAVPRTVTVNVETSQMKWSKIVSVWSAWTRPDESILEKMIESDLNLSKTSKLLGDNTLGLVDEQLILLRAAILPYYAGLISSYRVLSVQGSGHAVFGITYNTLVSIGDKCDSLFDDTFSRQTIINHSIAACVVDKKQQAAVRINVDGKIVRFQFLETLIRSANSKFVTSGKAEDLCEGVEMIFEELEDYLKEHNAHEDQEHFLEALFIEEVDLVFKTFFHILRGVYDMYAEMNSKPGCSGLLSLPGWLDFLSDCNAWDDKFARRHASQAFVYGLMWQVDEVSSERHMHLNFVEFLVAIGAVVYMRQFWYEAEFADLVEEFLEDILVPLFERKGSQLQKDAVTAKNQKAGPTGKLAHISKNELRASFATVFKIADEDGDGTLTMREFKNAFRDPQVISVLGGGNSKKIEDMIKIFEAMDADGGKTLSVEEAMEGFAAIRAIELTRDRAYAFLYNLCQNAANEDGIVASFPFMISLRSLSTQRKLMRVSVDPADIFARFDGAKGAPQSFELDALVEQLMKFRTGKVIPKWKIALKQVFEVADVDFGGSVTKSEWANVMKSSSVIAKFESCGISLNVLHACFDVLDLDGSGDLTERELVDGLEQLLYSKDAGVLQETPMKDDRDEVLPVQSAKESEAPKKGTERKDSKKGGKGKKSIEVEEDKTKQSAPRSRKRASVTKLGPEARLSLDSRSGSPVADLEPETSVNAGDSKRSARKSIAVAEPPPRRDAARKSVHAPDLVTLAKLSDRRFTLKSSDEDVPDSGSGSGSASSLKSGDGSQ